MSLQTFILNVHGPPRIFNFDFDAKLDPDPAFHFNADPDPAFHSNAFRTSEKKELTKNHRITRKIETFVICSVGKKSQHYSILF